jgi:hypothetical protein
MRVHRIIAAFCGAAALLFAAAPAGAQAEHETQHNVVDFTDPNFAGFAEACTPALGVLTVLGEEVVHFTDTARTHVVVVNTHGSFTFDPHEPGLLSSSGHFVSQHREHVNFGQLKGFRVTDTIHAVATFEDGTSAPIQVMTTLLFSADGNVEVKFDRVKCGSQTI